MTGEVKRAIAILETARNEMIGEGVPGWPNAVLVAIELLSTPPCDDEVERLIEAADYLVDRQTRILHGQVVRDLEEASLAFTSAKALARAAISTGGRCVR